MPCMNHIKRSFIAALIALAALAGVVGATTPAVAHAATVHAHSAGLLSPHANVTACKANISGQIGDDDADRYLDHNGDNIDDDGNPIGDGVRHYASWSYFGGAGSDYIRYSASQIRLQILYTPQPGQGFQRIMAGWCQAVVGPFGLIVKDSVGHGDVGQQPPGWADCPPGFTCS